MRTAGTSWIREWAQNGLPRNPTTGATYNGSNILRLWSACVQEGYPSCEFATYKQWQAKGAQVRRGAKADYIMAAGQNRVKKVEPVEQPNGEVEEVEVESWRKYFKTFSVFSAEQVEGYTPQVRPEMKRRAENNAIPEVDEWVASVGIDVRENPGQAFYAPGKDFVSVPTPGLFASAEARYSTEFHELIHATGAQHRLARDFTKDRGNRFGDPAYAAEELVAELGSAFLCAQHGIVPEPSENTAKYLNSWIRLLQDDEDALMKAATKAGEAVAWLNEHATPPAAQQ